MVGVCERCGQSCIADDCWSIRGYCDTCRDRQYGADERHERVRLFDPLPAPMAGQLELRGGGSDDE